MAGMGHTAGRQLAALTLVAATGWALAGCSGAGGGGTSTSAGSGATGSSTPTGGSGPSTSSSSSSSGATSSGSSGSTSSGRGAAATRCTASTTRTRAVTQPGGGAAGSFVVELVTTDTGTRPCTLQGYPGVSLTAPGTGAQVGAAADRDRTQSTPLVRLAPGSSATALVKVTQAANYGSRCHLVTAGGFRVYLPGETAAQYAPYRVEACSNTDVHLLSVRPFHG